MASSDSNADELDKFRLDGDSWIDEGSQGVWGGTGILCSDSASPASLLGGLDSRLSAVVEAWASLSKDEVRGPLSRDVAESVSESSRACLGMRVLWIAE
jgi:hypothetical protein